MPGKVWLVGPDALAPAEHVVHPPLPPTPPAAAASCCSNRRTRCVQGLQPAEMELPQNNGRTAFAEDSPTRSCADLQDKDFFTWEPGEIVYRNAYLKPQRGAKSLVQCNESLANSALLTIPVGHGLVTLCQLVVGEKLAEQSDRADAVC